MPSFKCVCAFPFWIHHRPTLPTPLSPRRIQIVQCSGTAKGENCCLATAIVLTRSVAEAAQWKTAATETLSLTEVQPYDFSESTWRHKQVQKTLKRRAQDQHARELIISSLVYFCYVYRALILSGSICTTQIKQQRPESPTVTFTWHACNTRYINSTRGTCRVQELCESRDCSLVGFPVDNKSCGLYRRKATLKRPRC